MEMLRSITGYVNKDIMKFIVDDAQKSTCISISTRNDN